MVVLMKEGRSWWDTVVASTVRSRSPDQQVMPNKCNSNDVWSNTIDIDHSCKSPYSYGRGETALTIGKVSHKDPARPAYIPPSTQRKKQFALHER